MNATIFIYMRRHSLAGVWIEIPRPVPSALPVVSHSLAGVWIEILRASGQRRPDIVTPLRECGLKYQREF